MADWKMPMSYNFNPTYHAYAYGLMYPQASEHGHPNLSWAEAAYTHPGGVTGGFYSSQAAQQSPSWSSENPGTNNYWHYPTNRLNERLFVSSNTTELDPKAKDCEQAESDTPSDSEAHTPDSWSSGSSREGAAMTNLNLLSWREGDRESDRGSPEGGGLVSNSLSVVNETAVDLSLEAEGLPLVPPMAVFSGRLVAQSRKTRAAFSEEQMNALVHRFSVQRYLTPAEMKELAEATGLTYKQVKTWFQNRRMKLKRHQRDNSWMTERYVINGVSNPPGLHPQSDNLSSKEAHSNSQLRESTLTRSPPHTSFYPSYSKQHSPPQTTIRPPGNWPLTPAVMHYRFPNNTHYTQASINSDVSSAVGKGCSPPQMPSPPGATQWST